MNFCSELSIFRIFNLFYFWCCTYKKCKHFSRHLNNQQTHLIYLFKRKSDFLKKLIVCLLTIFPQPKKIHYKKSRPRKSQWSNLLENERLNNEHWINQNENDKLKTKIWIHIYISIELILSIIFKCQFRWNEYHIRIIYMYNNTRNKTKLHEIQGDYQISVIIKFTLLNKSIPNI